MMMEFDLQRFAALDAVVLGKTNYYAVDISDPTASTVTNTALGTSDSLSQGDVVLEITNTAGTYTMKLMKASEAIAAGGITTGDKLTKVTAVTDAISLTGVEGVTAEEITYDLSNVDISITVPGNNSVKNLSAGDQVIFGTDNGTVTINGTSFTGVTSSAPQFEYIGNKLTLTDGTLDFTTTAASNLTLGIAATKATSLVSTVTLNGKMKFKSDGAIEDMATGAIVSGIPATKTVSTATSAAKDEFTVNNTKFVATGAGAGLEIVAMSVTSELKSGTVYLTADSSDASSVKVNGGTVPTIKATNGDVTVNVNNTTVTIGDLDNGDTVQINDDTYSVVNGVFTHTAGNTNSNIADGKTLTSATAGNYVLETTFDTADLTQFTAPTSPANVAINGVLSTGTAIDATVAEAAVNLGYGTTDTTAKLSQIVDNAYVHQDGTITTTAKTGDLATVSYDATNEVVNYNASSSAKYQKIDLGADKNVWNVTGTEYGDVIVGNTGGKESTLSGGSGKDTITAEANNVAIGGAGADSIVAGASAINVATAASMTGGADADVFDVAAGGQYAVITDFSLADGDVVSVTSAAVDKAGALANFGVEGDATLGTSRVSLQSSDGFYTARLKDATDTRIVAWVGENATAIDNSGTNYKNVIFKGTGNDKGDVLTGGTGNDTFLGGIGDSIVGGAGNDSISLTAKTATNEEVGRYVAISSTSGKDTVDGFTAAFDTVDGDWLGVTDGASTDIVITTLATKSAAGNVTVKSGNGSAVLNNVKASTDTGAVELNINGAKVATIAEGTIATIGSADYAQYYIGTKGTSKKSGANLSSVTGDLMVDLSQTEIIRNIDTLVGGAGNTTLMGSTSADSLVAGEGRTSLWGGASGSDTLVSGADTTSFFYGTGSGKDTVVGFQTADVDASDVLTFIDGGFGNISRTNANAFEVKMSSGEKLTVNQGVSGADKAVNWQLMDGTASGVAKIALANNKLTYDNTVTNYFGSSSKDTVSVASSADNVSIWLDGSQGVSYSSIEIVDAKSSTGNVTLAGGSGAETIYGGQGASSLWGGADTSNDVLVGSGKGTAMFFYGLGQGNDVINATTKNDAINLYGVKLSDITAAAVDSTKVTITTTANETLTVNGSVTKFTTGDGQTFYADHRNKDWSTTAV